VSATFLNSLPEVAPIVTPRITGAGRPGPDALAGFAVGDVVRVRRADTDEYYVVLDGGVQRIGMVAADLIRFGAGASADIPAIAASAVAAVPTLGVLPVSEYPDRLAPPAHQRDDKICVTAAGDAVSVYAGSGPAGEQRPVVLAQADGAGPAVDEVFIPPGRSLYVRPSGIGPPLGSVIADTGVRFPLGDAETARILGLPDTAEPAPWAVLAALPVGPVLSRAAALAAYDVVPGAAPPAGQG
jgi:type VII secretion protein EccB